MLMKPTKHRYLEGDNVPKTFKLKVKKKIKHIRTNMNYGNNKWTGRNDRKPKIIPTNRCPEDGGEKIARDILAGTGYPDVRSNGKRTPGTGITSTTSRVE